MMKIEDIKNWWLFIRKHPVIAGFLILVIVSVTLIVAPYICNYSSEKGKQHASTSSSQKPPLQQTAKGDRNIQVATKGPNSPTSINAPKYYPDIKEETRDIRDVAYAIYTEVLGIVKKLKNHISGIEKGEKVDFSEARLNQKILQDFDKRSLLPQDDLKNQLTIFCNTINSIDKSFQRQDFQRAVEQGEDALKKLSQYYGFKDYDAGYKITNMTAVSPDVSAVSPNGSR